jgi:hypothetical protein
MSYVSAPRYITACGSWRATWKTSRSTSSMPMTASISCAGAALAQTLILPYVNTHAGVQLASGIPVSKLHCVRQTRVLWPRHAATPRPSPAAYPLNLTHQLDTQSGGGLERPRCITRERCCRVVGDLMKGAGGRASSVVELDQYLRRPRSIGGRVQVGTACEICCGTLRIL